MRRDIAPVVLVGGASSRFGSDKLRASLAPGVWLVDRPIAALRAVFGARVAAVGDAEPEVSARADVVLPDRYPGAGPAGGIVTALEWSGTDVLVLAGDLPEVTEASVRALMERADDHRDALACLARTRKTEPCIGIYRAQSAGLLTERLSQGWRSLHDALPPERVELVRIPDREARNVNSQADLP